MSVEPWSPGDANQLTDDEIGNPWNRHPHDFLYGRLCVGYARHATQRIGHGVRRAPDACKCIGEPDSSAGVNFLGFVSTR